MVGESKKLLLPPPLKSLFINALRVMVRAVRVKREKKNRKKKSGCGGGESSLIAQADSPNATANKTVISVHIHN